MSSTFNWIFGKRKASPPASQTEEVKPTEDDFVIVNDGGTVNDNRPGLYPLINPDSIKLTEDPEEQSETKAHENVHGDVGYYLSGVPFQIATPIFTYNDIAHVQHFLYLTKRTTNLNNYSYDFALELSVVNQ